MKHPNKTNAYCRGLIHEYMSTLGGYHNERTFETVQCILFLAECFHSSVLLLLTDVSASPHLQVKAEEERLRYQFAVMSYMVSVLGNILAK
jgi:hypothetical protein